MQPPPAHTHTIRRYQNAHTVISRPLAEPAIAARQEVAQEKLRLDEVRRYFQLLNSAVFGCLREMLGERFYDVPQSPPSDAFNLVPMDSMPRWQSTNGFRMTSPDFVSRVWIRFSIAAKIPYDSEQVSIAAWLQVVDRHKGLENFAFEWSGIYSAPLGSVQFVRAGDEIKVAVQNSEGPLLQAVAKILARSDQEVPEWYAT